MFYRSNNVNDAGNRLQWQIEFLSAVEELPSSQKRILCLKYGLLEDMSIRSNKRVSELMEMSEEGVRKALKEAMETIRSSKYAKVLESVPLDHSDTGLAINVF